MTKRQRFAALPFDKPTGQLTKAEALANLRHMHRDIRKRLEPVEHVHPALLPVRLRAGVLRDRHLLDLIERLMADIESTQEAAVFH